MFIEILIGANLVMLLFVQIWVGAYFIAKVLRGDK